MNKYLDIDRLEFAITYECNSKCKHCQLGGKEERREFPSHINQDLAVEIVRKVGKKYNPKSIMTFGGEPLLYPEIVYGIHREATRVGIPVREIITNGFWSRNPEKIQEIANKLAKSGVNEVCFSVDCFHQEFVPLKTVKKAVESLLEAGITNVSWDPCWVIARDNNNLYNRKTRSILENLEDLRVRTSEGNTAQPEGRAVLWLKDFLPRKTRTPKGRCGDIPYTEDLDSVRTVFTEPDGRIAVCKEFYIGDASEADVIDILECYDPFKIPEAKAIIESGMTGLLALAKTEDVKPNPDGYYNICHLCKDLRKRMSCK